MKFKMRLEIHFYSENKGAVYSKLKMRGGEEDKEEYSDLLMFCNLLCRNLYNLGNYAWYLYQKVSFIDTKDIKKDWSQLNPEMPEIMEFEGRGEKIFISDLESQGKDVVGNYQLKTKGFGFFQKGMEHYSSNAVLLYLLYLREKYNNNEKFLTKLVEAIKICGGALISGDLGPRKEGKITTMIASSYLD